MTTSLDKVDGAFHSRVYRSTISGECFILLPDVAPGDPRRFDTQVYQVDRDPRSADSDTYQVFRMVRRREELEQGVRLVGIHWGTHTILEPAAEPPWDEVQRFKSRFEGTGCVLFLIGVPAAGLGFICLASRLVL